MINSALRKRGAAFAAPLFYTLLIATGAGVDGHAAIPVEESQEEPSIRTPASSERSSQARRLPNLDIPPTIESNNPIVEVAPDPRITTGNTAPTYRSSVAGGAVAANVSASSDSAGLTDIFYQLQVLQQEVQTLRGQVEEQEHLLKRLQRDQKEQYVDLDRRLLALGSNKPTPAPRSSSTGSATATGTPTTEREAYRVAFDAMRERRFDESKLAFQQIVERYPNGQYTPNAFYWLGEIFLVADQDLEQARQSFMQVINLYPDHQKASDALYKLGVVYHGLGDTDAAQRYLGRVQREYPDSSAAGLARKYAAEL